MAPDTEFKGAGEPAAAISAGDETDRLEAVKIRASTSTSLLALTVTTGAAGIALIAFATGLHAVSTLAVISWALGGLSLFASAISGGLAIRRVSRDGANGNWNLDNPRAFWQVQIWAFAIGALLLSVGAAVTFSGPTRASDERAQDRRIGALSSEVHNAGVTQARLQRELRRLRRRVVRAPRRP
jgi:uncharacterized protein (DUF2062 family)